jgi:hypothetical protein
MLASQLDDVSSKTSQHKYWQPLSSATEKHSFRLPLIIEGAIEKIYHYKILPKSI